MRSLGERTHLLRKRLINLRCGPGAVKLPAEVTRIHLDFAVKIDGGHMGAKKFWREHLPQLKYHNPSIPMIVNRHEQNERPPLMSIYLRRAAPQTDADAEVPVSSPEAQITPTSSRKNLSKAPAPTPDEQVVHVDMKEQHSAAILETFLTQTRAVILQPTGEEIAEMQDLEAMRRKGMVDRQRIERIKAEKKKEEDMLRRARELGGLLDSEAI